MSNLFTICTYSICAINALTFVTYAIDKLLAIKDRRRVSEKNLLLLATIGGALGALLSMVIFRHKIRKMRFVILVPLLLVIQCAIVWIVLNPEVVKGWCYGA